jgi:hypothetical protein
MSRTFYGALLGTILAVALGQAQEPPAGGWRKLGERGPADVPPAQLTLPAGTWIAVRVNDPLSSNENHPGDGFTATLVRPLVVQGFVVARRGQTIGGRVVEVEKAGRVKGTSRLGLELAEISLNDGQQLPIRTELIQFSGGTSKGRDATAIATTTGVGAAVGAAADGGFGAGVGAMAGAAASTVGVLVTRGRHTLVLPEDVLTFRITAPVTISTEAAAHAFPPVTEEDYESRELRRRVVSRPPPTLYPPPYYYSNYYYRPYYYSPYFYGPSFGFGFYSRPFGFRGGGFRRRW